MRDLRNRVQHDLYGERTTTPEKEIISVGKTITSYPFPTFTVGQSIRLTENDIEAIVIEVRAQFNNHLIPYINSFFIKRIPIIS